MKKGNSMIILLMHVLFIRQGILSSNVFNWLKQGKSLKIPEANDLLSKNTKENNRKIKYISALAIGDAM